MVDLYRRSLCRRTRDTIEAHNLFFLNTTPQFWELKTTLKKLIFGEKNHNCYDTPDEKIPWPRYTTRIIQKAKWSIFDDFRLRIPAMQRKKTRQKRGIP